jgi:hypothetical protein
VVGRSASVGCAIKRTFRDRRSSLCRRSAAAAPPGGDADGSSDDADHNVWRAHFGQTAGSGSSAIASVVPEPIAGTLFLPGLMGLGLLRLTLACDIKRKSKHQR